MIIDTCISSPTASRERLIVELKKIKSDNPSFTVIDVLGYYRALL